jgi:hypothetical protein
MTCLQLSQISAIIEAVTDFVNIAQIKLVYFLIVPYLICTVIDFVISSKPVFTNYSHRNPTKIKKINLRAHNTKQFTNQ